jgi:lysophospholipase L1-like esterase
LATKLSFLRSAALLAALVLVGCVQTAELRQSHAEAWITTWGASDTVPASDSKGFNNQTLRLIVHTSLGGEHVRIRIANTFGSRPVTINRASVGLRNSGATLAAGSNRALTFSGDSSISIPIGAYVLSDSVALSIPAQGDLAVSIYVAADAGPVSAHPLANQTSYVSGPGDFTLHDDAAPFASDINNWPYLAAIEVRPGKASRSIVAFGDSITDGYRSTADANHRWPDYLANRLVAAQRNMAVVNEGIGGNRIWHDAIPTRLVFGPSGLSRFDRDALSLSGVSHVVVLLGINDIGQASPSSNPEQQVSAAEIIAGLKQFAIRAHARGVKIIGATLTPYGGAAYFDAQGEAKRLAVNGWIRTTADLDGVIDFDAALRDVNRPAQLQAAFDSGDHLHPSDAGYQAMAAGINLSVFD